MRNQFRTFSINYYDNQELFNSEGDFHLLLSRLRANPFTSAVYVSHNLFRVNVCFEFKPFQKKTDNLMMTYLLRIYLQDMYDVIIPHVFPGYEFDLKQKISEYYFAAIRKHQVKKMFLTNERDLIWLTDINGKTQISRIQSLTLN